ncbi:(S)-2-haloacid dehalogenase 4A (plasmid) [Corynebacterium occultum]|uniref:(S)-2-haloacid dehalogenase 4A n=2 Tax=Corynebacterium occultum TaxID=2675219 RepID=A0A6B8WBN3_9CORY|nr:(S)-2-haloacid dehalogenase 4A [Corynebacterium occultum]
MIPTQKEVRIAMIEPRPTVVIFDVNETLSDQSSLRDRLVEVGAPAELLPEWFSGILRDGMALTAAGGYADFADLARDGLRALLPARAGLTPSDGLIDQVVAGFHRLDVHPDVAEGVRLLHGSGIRLITMTNGSTTITEALLDRAGLREYFELHLDVRGPRRWKPAPAAYGYALARAGVAAGDALLVAVHPWDVDGALRAGLRGAWIRRGQAATAYPKAMVAPTITADDLVELGAMFT